MISRKKATPENVKPCRGLSRAGKKVLKDVREVEQAKQNVPTLERMFAEVEAAQVEIASASQGEPDFGLIRLDGVATLQRLFDENKISIPGVKADDTCHVQRTVQHEGMEIEVACPHRAVLREIVKEECLSCNHKKTETIVYLCLLHAIEHHGQGAPILDEGPLFGAKRR
jgi:hypothetical protein